MQRAEDVRREEHQQGAKEDAERQAREHRAAELLQEERLAVELNMRQTLERQQAEMLLEKQNNSHEQHTVASGVADVHDFDGFDVNSEDFEGGVDAQAVQDVEDEDAVDSSESSDILLPGAGSANSVRGTTSIASDIEEKQKPIPTSTRVASSRGLASFLSRAVEDDDDFGDHASSVTQPVASNTGFTANPNLNQQVAKNTSTVRSSALRDFSDDFDF
ncbi:Hypothetical protein, putative [Bodo saltans]|uniref:Uncharacterized protein n=1 Tax=Bodo saltans TaxID=75058 RepID=A0A0S4ILI6_BODSA|nr:Hypothetical protein, putative [Bodo saltans]|eukprot:CUF25683.1 Hypothetical protein, putative [Bodo saltans]